MSLKQRARQALQDAEGLLVADTAVKPRRLLAEARDAVEAPMRVALVGRVKAGKSTVMNALLGRLVAPTGPEELTFNVNWFHFAEEPGIVVHFRDGRPPEPRAMEWLGRLVTRTSGDAALLGSIRHVEVGLNREILSRLQLIDTPGFGSFFEADSRNSLEFLGLTPDDVDRSTRSYAAGADAVVYLATRNLAAADQGLVEDFQGAAIGDFSPVNAIAALTKVDAYWSPDEPDTDPLDRGRTVARRLAEAPGTSRLFFDVLPVCGLLAAGAATLTDNDVAVLEKLAQVPADTLLRRLRFAGRFGAVEYEDLPVPVADRAMVLERLGRYGVWLARRHIAEAGPDRQALCEELLQASGIPSLERLLLSHFGNRAVTIKAAGSVNRCRATLSRFAQESTGAPARAAARAAGRLEAFEVDEHAVAELDLLRRLYQHDDHLGLSSEEVAELLRVTGEKGGSCADRLGLDSRTPPGEMLAMAQRRQRYWRKRALQFGISSATVHAARTVRRSYDVIAFHVRVAQQHLEMDP